MDRMSNESWFEEIPPTKETLERIKTAYYQGLKFVRFNDVSTFTDRVCLEIKNQPWVESIKKTRKLVKICFKPRMKDVGPSESDWELVDKQ